MMALPSYVGQRLSYKGQLLTVRYVGVVRGTEGEWLGVEWDDPTLGKNSGEAMGAKYFECQSKSPTAGLFIRPIRPFDKRLSFEKALRFKYASGLSTSTPDKDEQTPPKYTKISGKVVEEIGFEEISQVLADLRNLRVVLLDGLQVAGVGPGPWPLKEHMDEENGEQLYTEYRNKYDKVAQIYPNITELDLSRNCLEMWVDVAMICHGLDSLEALKVGGNRFNNLEIPGLYFPSPKACFKKLKNLALDMTFLSWEEIINLTEPMLVLEGLLVSSNALSTISTPLRIPTLTKLNLESNNFTALSDLQPLTTLRNLKVLGLRSNQISKLTAEPYQPPPIFRELVVFDLSDNKISSLNFIAHLPACVVTLTSLRISNNPVFANLTIDESFIVTLARIRGLTILNFSTVTAAERTNAELYYLSQIGKELSAAPSDREAEILSGHPRYHELCAEHGTPTINRHNDVNASAGDNTLGSRLIKFTFHKDGYEVMMRLPRTVNTYRIKSRVAPHFGLRSWHLRLIWETEEWDPVGPSAEEDQWSEGEEENDDGEGGEEAAAADHHGMVKREVELVDGTREVGFWVEGKEARVRVEERLNAW